MIVWRSAFVECQEYPASPTQTGSLTSEDAWARGSALAGSTRTSRKSACVTYPESND